MNNKNPEAEIGVQTKDYKQEQSTCLYYEMTFKLKMEVGGFFSWKQCHDLGVE